MSVRDCLLAVLTLGPAYGSQLHAELRVRAPHRGPINVGQIYSTLDRLSRHGFVAAAGATADGLPLYRLTAAGSEAALTWMTVPVLDDLPEWTGMLDQVLVTATLDSARGADLIDGFAAWWRADSASAGALVEADPLRRAAVLARRSLAEAADRWLISARDDLVAVERPLDLARPRRGRRPASAA